MREFEIVEIVQRGLLVCSEHPCLGASTDGEVQIINDDGSVADRGLFECKNLLQNKDMTLMEKAKSKKSGSFCLKFDGKKLTLKRNHKFFYQIQGQLNIFGYSWCDFVVRCCNPYQLHAERIFRDSELWETVMIPKLTDFYFKCLLPELASPRYGKSPGIREPGPDWVSSFTT